MARRFLACAEMPQSACLGPSGVVYAKQHMELELLGADKQINCADQNVCRNIAHLLYNPSTPVHGHEGVRTILLGETTNGCLEG